MLALAGYAGASPPSSNVAALRARTTKRSRRTFPWKNWTRPASQRIRHHGRGSFAIGIIYISGAADELCLNITADPVHVHDLQATILHLMGFDHEKFTYKFMGRDFRLTDVSGAVQHGLLA